MGNEDKDKQPKILDIDINTIDTKALSDISFSDNTAATTEKDIKLELVSALMKGDRNLWNKAVSDYKSLNNDKDNYIEIDNLKVKEMSYKGFNFDQVIFKNCEFKECHFSGNSRFEHSQIIDTKFIASNFKDVSFNHSILQNSQFSGYVDDDKNLHSNSFSNTRFYDSKISGTPIEGNFEKGENAEKYNIFYKNFINCSPVNVLNSSSCNLSFENNEIYSEGVITNLPLDLKGQNKVHPANCLHYELDYKDTDYYQQLEKTSEPKERKPFLSHLNLPKIGGRGESFYGGHITDFKGFSETALEFPIVSNTSFSIIGGSGKPALSDVPKVESVKIITGGTSGTAPDTNFSVNNMYADIGYMNSIGTNENGQGIIKAQVAAGLTLDQASFKGVGYNSISRGVFEFKPDHTYELNTLGLHLSGELSTTLGAAVTVGVKDNLIIHKAENIESPYYNKTSNSDARFVVNTPNPENEFSVFAKSPPIRGFEAMKIIVNYSRFNQFKADFSSSYTDENNQTHEVGGQYVNKPFGKLSAGIAFSF